MFTEKNAAAVGVYKADCLVVGGTVNNMFVYNWIVWLMKCSIMTQQWLISWNDDVMVLYFMVT